MQTQENAASYDPATPGAGAGAPAWIEWRVQRNRILVLLAAAGTGLLVTLLVAVGPVSELELVLAMAAGGAFFVALLAGLLGFERGARWRPDSTDPLAARLDGLLVIGFLAGVALTLLVGLAAGLSDLEQATEQDEPDSSGHYETSGIWAPSVPAGVRANAVPGGAEVTLACAPAPPYFGE